MEKDKLDKLFQGKLEDLQYVPSTNAWNELDRKLKKHKSKNSVAWLSIAASLTMVVASVAIIFNTISPNNSDQINTGKQTIENFEQHIDTVQIPTKEDMAHKPLTYELKKTNKISQRQIDNTLLPDKVSDKKQEVVNNQHQSIVNNKTISIQAIEVNETKVHNESIKEIVKTTPVMVISDINSVKEESIEANTEKLLSSSKTFKPVTITYKSTPEKPKNKFVQAISYIDDVKQGKRKLLNLEKIKKKITAKIKS